MSKIYAGGTLNDPCPSHGTVYTFPDVGRGFKAYKLMRLKKDGKVYPLFINKNVPTEFGKWMEAECHPTKGFEVRKGWHCCFKPIAPHLKEMLANGEQRVWVEVEVADYKTYKRPESQGGWWILADRMKANRVLTPEEVEEIRREEM